MFKFFSSLFSIFICTTIFCQTPIDIDLSILKESSGQRASTLEDDLLLHYTLDGNTLDSGPNMIDGVNNGGIVTFDRFGDQSAFSFDGNSNIEIPHDDTYKVQFPISVSTWVKWESDSPQKNGVFSTNFEQNNYHGVFMLRLAVSGKLFFGYGTGTGGITLANRRAIISDYETELNEWYHITGMINGPNDFHLYIDGCEETFTYTGDENPTIAYNENNGFLGKLDNSNTEPSNDLIGAIDDFYFWNRSITEEEVRDLYNRFEVPEFGLNDDYTIPVGQDDVTINISNEYSGVTWSDGQMGNSALFSEEGTYQVEAYYECHLVFAEFKVIKEIVFSPECDQVFDGSEIQESLLLHFDFEDNIENTTALNVNVINTDVNLVDDRFMDLSAGQFGDEQTLNLGHNSMLKPNFPMSFSFWVKRELSGVGTNYLYTSDLQLDRRAGFAISFGAFNDKLIFFYTDENGCYNPSCRRQMTSQRSFPAGEWFHISMVINAYDDAIFYANGCEVSLDYSGEGDIDLFYTEEPSYVGFADNSNQSTSQRAYFGGKIDDFYFWNRPITEEEILYLYDRFEVPNISLNDNYLIPNDQNAIGVVLSEEYSDVTWSDGQTGNEATFIEEGMYQVEAFYNCHLVCEEFTVEKEIVTPPDESCDFVQSFNGHCGSSKYHCVVSDQLGDSKYYLEGQLQLPVGYSLCESDLNDAINSLQNIYAFEVKQTGQVIDFRAFATILDLDVFFSEGLVIDVDICNGLEQTCISYILPYGTCSNDYDCTIDYRGVSLRDQESVNINYCMVLHDLSNTNCSSEYEISGYLMDANNEKLIFEETLSENLDSYNCISIPLSIDDFLSNEYNCIELRVTDICTGESCYRFDCNLFNSAQSVLSISENSAYQQEANVSVASRNEALQFSVSPFPNPTKSQVSFPILGDDTTFEIRTNQGEIIEVPFSKTSDLIVLDMSQLTGGVYFLSIISGDRLTNKKIIKID